MNIAIGNDHAGTAYKFEIIKLLESKGHTVENFGTDEENSIDYPDFIHPVANAVEQKKADLGIIICGSGNGAQMTANKHQGVGADGVSRFHSFAFIFGERYVYSPYTLS